VDRRAFIGTLAGGLLVAPRVAGAQHAQTSPRLGMLLTGSPSDRASSRELDALTKKLSELGWVEGRTLGVEIRWAKNLDSLPSLASELTRLGVDVILTPGPEATIAARKATSTIPIVMIASTDPRTIGAVGLARPGGNVTGLTIGQPELVTEKRLELLKETLPGISHVAILWDVKPFGDADRTAPLSAAARSLKLQLLNLDVTGIDFEGAFTTAKKAGVGAVVLMESPRTVVNRTLIAALGLKHRLPVMSQFRVLVEAGGLMSYGPDLSDLFARAAPYIDKILKGTKPGDLPIEQPSKFEFVINLKTAKALGLTIPPSLLQRADQVIE
jgi:putative tryptophan/tyrosine transport system substrate-binding protein